ncbi:MAG: hypothetical protein ISS36_03365 [Candidatus Aenigmarchaeota archaeon]|nr:hypothetical protein [Candidatus Aenigmarchaeota archaeon]
MKPLVFALAFMIFIISISSVSAVEIRFKQEKLAITMGQQRDVTVVIENTEANDIDVKLILKTTEYGPSWFSNINPAKQINFNDFSITDTQFIVSGLKPGKDAEVYIRVVAKREDGKDLVFDASYDKSGVSIGTYNMDVVTRMPPGFSGLEFFSMFLLIVLSGFVYWRKT